MASADNTQKQDVPKQDISVSKNVKIILYTFCVLFVFVTAIGFGVYGWKTFDDSRILFFSVYGISILLLISCLVLLGYMGLKK